MTISSSTTSTSTPHHATAATPARLATYSERLGTRPDWSALRVPDQAVPSVNLAFDTDVRVDVAMSVPETAALLRMELKRVFPELRCTVRVTHPWHGSVRVRARGHATEALGRRLGDFLRKSALLRYDAAVTDDHWHHAVVLQYEGVACRVTNDVRSVWVEWV